MGPGDGSCDGRFLRPLAKARPERTVAGVRGPGEESLVAAMMRPEFYPKSPASVEFRQTHISYVFLAGDFAYKVKKAVRFSFIDSLKLETRYHLCAEEVRLNSRISPEMYLGVFAILGRGKNFLLGPRVKHPHGKAIEYAVKMRRLPEQQMLDRLLAAGLVDSAAIRAIAARIAEFRKNVPADYGWRYGCAAELRQAMTAELTENREFIGDMLGQDEFAEIHAFILSFIASHLKQIGQRAASGRVREGHGDLRAEHIRMGGNRVDVIDCVEFSERLRYCDAASEIAFLAMDLDRLDAPALADELVASYARAAGDRELPQFVPFYKCYRASVRGKVESLRSRELKIAAPEREQARECARGYFALASRYARLASPAIVAVCGLSGTGKSAMAETLQGRTGFAIINSDRVRKRLAGVAPNRRQNSDYGTGLYCDQFSKMTYETMLAEAEESLREGRGVILDATFKASADRWRVRALARRHGVPLLLVECVAAKEEVMRRLERRNEIADEVSDATPAIYEMQVRGFEPLNEGEELNHITVDTGRDRGQVAGAINAALDRLIVLRGTS